MWPERALADLWGIMESWRALLTDWGLSELGSSRLDADAAAVVETLSRGGYRPRADVELIRKHYTNGMAGFLAPLQDVDKITRVAPSDGSAPLLMIVRPLCAFSDPLPALVYLHGGGWTFGDLALYEPFLRRLANATGRVVVVVDYRLAPEHPFPAALEDAWNAVEWVAVHAVRIGVDPDQIAIGGDDAGGNLAAVTAIAARIGLIDVSLQFQLLIYPCLDMTASLPSHHAIPWCHPLTWEMYDWCRDNYVGTFPDLEDWHLSPLFAEDLRGIPPAVVVYAGFDPLRDEATLYCSRLRQAGITVTPIFCPDLMHGFVTMAIPAAAEAIGRIASVIHDQFGGAPSPQHDGCRDLIPSAAG